MLNPDNATLEWCAKCIEDSLRAETNERTIEFGKNMAMTIRAVKTKDAPVPDAGADEGESKGCCQHGHYHINMYGHPAKRLCKCPLNTDNRWICAAALRAATLRSGKES